MPRLEGQGTRGGNKGSRCRASYATKVRLHLYLFVLLQRTESPCFQTFFSSSSLLLLPVLPAVACLLLAIRSFLLSYLLFLLHRRKGPSKHPSASPPLTSQDSPKTSRNNARRHPQRPSGICLPCNRGVRVRSASRVFGREAPNLVTEAGRRGFEGEGSRCERMHS